MSGRTQSMGQQQAERRTANCLGNANPAATHADSELQWPIYTLGDLMDRGDAELQTGPFGTMLHAKAYTKDGTPVVAVKNIGDNRLVDDDIPRVDHETALRLERYRLLSGDIVFGRKGAVDRRALVKPEEEGWLQGSDCIRLRLNQNRIQPRFISFVLGSATHRAWFIQQAHGATMPSLNQEILSRLPLPIPPYGEQKIVAGVLGTLDDKIELNRKMNETLEAMARALFKSWFVDFDPVRAKAEGRDTGLPEPIAALFPDSFGDSELGEVPKGWGAGPLLEQARLLSGGTPKTDRVEYWEDGDVLWASAKDVSQSPQTLLIRTERNITRLGLEQSATQLIPQFATVVVARGATTGRMVMFGREMAMNQTCYALVSGDASPFGLYCLLRHTMPELVHAAHGSVFDTITTATFNQAHVTNPPKAVKCAFEMTVRPLFERILSNSIESETLTNFRDTLLPKLISGELRVATQV